jgi:AraC-like DNA-binding protein
MRKGRVEVSVRGENSIWEDGALFLANPYEIHAGDTNDVLTYDVCYPTRALMLEMFEVSAGTGGSHPHFSEIVISPSTRIAALADIVSNLAKCQREGSSARFEQALIDFFRENRDLFLIHFVEHELSRWVSSACALLEHAVAESLDPGPLIDRIGCSRSYLTRQFHKVTGITPGVYLRQLRLARARALLCEGRSIADVAADMGFADQPHLSREFKRAYGTTPGKLVRDVSQQDRVTL